MELAQTLAVWALPVLFAVTVHEAAHGYAALRCGDPTARDAGRLTLNPLPHVHWFGTVALPLLLVALAGVAAGWAKPVPVDPARLRRPRPDLALVAAAGPAANALMLLLWAALGAAALRLDAPLLLAAAQAGIIVNALLLLINLLPIPPLDGAQVLGALLPPRLAARWRAAGRWLLLPALALILLGFQQGFLLAPLAALIGAAHALFGLPWGPPA